MRTALSVQGATIRITEWALAHVAADHPEVHDAASTIRETIETPQRIVAGRNGELIAIRSVRVNKWNVVVYRVEGEEGFVITSFYVDRPGYYLNRRQLWP